MIEVLRNKEMMQDTVEKQLKPLLTQLEQLHSLHRKIWRETSSPFGWEILDHRYGGLKSRIASLHEILEEYMTKSTPIPEFETQISRQTDKRNYHKLIISYGRAASPNCTYISPRWWGDSVHY